jgi:hypothetical protein
MPSSNPSDKPVPHDLDRQRERERPESKHGRDDNATPGDPEAHDTDPDDPNAEINRDDMTDEL